MKHCVLLRNCIHTTQPTTVLELLRGRLGGILRKLEMLEELPDIQRSSAVAQTP